MFSQEQIKRRMDTVQETVAQQAEQIDALQEQAAGQRSLQRRSGKATSGFCLGRDGNGIVVFIHDIGYNGFKHTGGGNRNEAFY